MILNAIHPVSSVPFPPLQFLHAHQPWKPAACCWKALFLFAVLGLPAAAPRNEGDNQPATPAQQYQTLIKEYQTAASAAAVNDEERRKTIERVENLRESLSRAFSRAAPRNTPPIRSPSTPCCRRCG